MRTDGMFFVVNQKKCLIRAVIAEYPNYQEFDNDCNDLINKGYIYLTQCFNPKDENQKMAFFIKYLET